MATQRSKAKKSKGQAGTAETRRGVSTEAKKMRVIESGSDEQEGDRIAGTISGGKRERDEYRHGGIPLGSDPRE
jgi:hypothetical protein